MHEPYLEYKDHWPAVEMSMDFYSHVASELRLYPLTGKRMYIKNRKSFLKLINRNEKFGEFWKQICETKPEKAEYFASLNDTQMCNQSHWIVDEYFKFLREKEFNKVPEDKRRELHTEFYKLRPEAYQAALKGEAIRLNCSVSEVKPFCPVLPLTHDGREESRLLEMPNAILLNIMGRLDILDLFRVTLVCKSWKSVIYNNNNSWHLRRAEFAKTTYLITFTEWMDPARTPSQEVFKDRYAKFSLGLIKWCCGIAEHLETIILDQPITSVDAATLIQSCPDLKNFQLGCDQTTFECFHDGPLDVDVVPPKLEFYSSRMYNTNYESDMNMEILLSCESLLYFGAPSMRHQYRTYVVREHLEHAFGKLIALDLVKCELRALEILAHVDDLRLKYFGIGELLPSYTLPGDYEICDLRYLLQRILPKLMTLELLKIGAPGIGGSIIKLLTELRLNLKFVVLQETIGSRGSLYNDPNEEDFFDAEVLTDFGQMLLSNDPRLDLSEFYFFVSDKEVPLDFREMDFGFTFISSYDDYEMDRCDVRLNFPNIKRRLGIDF